jgi:uncharacterized protein (DUF2062 family)
LNAQSVGLSLLNCSKSFSSPVASPPVVHQDSTWIFAVPEAQAAAASVGAALAPVPFVGVPPPLHAASVNMVSTAPTPRTRSLPMIMR